MIAIAALYRAEIKRQRRKLEAESTERQASVTLGVTPFLLLQMMDDIVDMRERLNHYEWHNMQDQYRREQKLKAEHEQGKGQKQGAKKHFSQHALAQLKQQQHVGFLHKRGEHNTSWKKRYFELENFTVKYYAQPGDTQEKGSIIVTHIDVQNAGPDGEHSHVFHLRSQDRIYVLAADTADEKREWMEKIVTCRQIIVSEVSGMQTEPESER